MRAMSKEVLVQIEGLKQYFPIRSGGKRTFVKAVDDVDLTIYRGETLGLVGESGSGKTTLSRAILGLQKPTAGKVILLGKDVWDKKNKKALQGHVGAVFQDPASSLNPRTTVYRSLERPLEIAGHNKKEARELIYRVADRINIGRELLERFPNELSGGQQQRISVARVISQQPELVVLDEPTSALDVSVQAQTLNELLKLQEDYGMAYLFITHNLSVVRYMSDRICVMYGGKVMEIGTVSDVYDHYLHPYTFGLFTSIPPLHPRDRFRKKYLLTGDMPSLIGISEGCRFASRCRYCEEKCHKETPALKHVGGEHYCACHFAGELDFD